MKQWKRGVLWGIEILVTNILFSGAVMIATLVALDHFKQPHLENAALLLLSHVELQNILWIGIASILFNVYQVVFLNRWTLRRDTLEKNRAPDLGVNWQKAPQAKDLSGQTKGPVLVTRAA